MCFLSYVRFFEEIQRGFALFLFQYFCANVEIERNGEAIHSEIEYVKEGPKLLVQLVFFPF